MKDSIALAFGLGLLFATISAESVEATEIRISKGYGMSYLPLVIMQEQKLLEQQAGKRGITDLKVQWLLIDGGSQVNDAMLAGAVDIAGTGLPGMVALWDKAKNSPRTDVAALASLSSFSVYLNTRNPAVKTIADFSSRDKIGLPSIKTSLAAGILQMAAAKHFGIDNATKLDSLTVSIPQPDGMAALTSGVAEITAHFTTPPFSYMELQDPKIHRVLSSVDVLGHTSLALALSLRRFIEANPKLGEAFVAALDEANDFIRDHRAEATDIFINTSNIKVPPEIAKQIMDDPDTIYQVEPVGIKEYVDFMHSTGIIKSEVKSWKELFVGPVKERNGS